MRLLFIVIVNAGLFYAQSVSNERSAVCVLQERQPDTSGLSTVHGRLAFTAHGAVLYPDGCTKGGQAAALLFSGRQGSPKVDFGTDQRSVDLLTPFFRPAGGAAEACGTLVGRVVVRKHFHIKNFGGGPQGNGYGSRGVLRFAFVMKSVTEVQQCEAAHATARDSR